MGRLFNQGDPGSIRRSPVFSFIYIETKTCFGGVSVLFVSPTLHNMHLAASKTLIDTIAPDHIFPQHFGTYEPNEQNSYWTVGYPDELKASLSTELQDSFHKLEPGRVFTIDP